MLAQAVRRWRIARYSRTTVLEHAPVRADAGKERRMLCARLLRYSGGSAACRRCWSWTAPPAPAIGERRSVTLTDVFASFIAHHRIEVRFCNPYSGHEKGSGGERGRVPAPVICSCRSSPARAGATGPGHARPVRTGRRGGGMPEQSPGSSVADVFCAEAQRLLALPSVRFDAVRWENQRTDKPGAPNSTGTAIWRRLWRCRRTVHDGRAVGLSIPHSWIPPPADRRRSTRAYADGGSVMMADPLIMPMLAKSRALEEQSGARADAGRRHRMARCRGPRSDHKDRRSARSPNHARTAGFAPAMDACRRLHGADPRDRDRPARTSSARRDAHHDGEATVRTRPQRLRPVPRQGGVMTETTMASSAGRRVPPRRRPPTGSSR